MFTATSVVHTKLPPDPILDSQTTSPYSYTQPTDKNSNKQTQWLNKLNSGLQKLRASYRNVSHRQTGMCLKRQPDWRSLPSTYRSTLNVWVGTLVPALITFCPPYKSGSFQKPWMNSQVRQMLHARSLAFRDGVQNWKYRLRKNIKDAKKKYKEKLDSFDSTVDVGSATYHRV